MSAAANSAAVYKHSNYDVITSTHVFIPIASETAGSWNAQAVEIIHELGRRVTDVVNEPQETQHF